jgi:hypothetical protein
MFGRIKSKPFTCLIWGFSFYYIKQIDKILPLSVQEGDIGIYGMAVLAYFSYGTPVFTLKNCGFKILQILRYTVFAILDSKTAVIDKITVLNTPQCPPRSVIDTQYDIMWEKQKSDPLASAAGGHFLFPHYDIILCIYN